MKGLGAGCNGKNPLKLSHVFREELRILISDLRIKGRIMSMYLPLSGGTWGGARVEQRAKSGFVFFPDFMKSQLPLTAAFLFLSFLACGPSLWPALGLWG